MRTLAPLIMTVIYVVGSAQAPTQAAPQAPDDNAAKPCGRLGTAHTRTTLYFGLTHRAGTVTDGQWQAFLRDEVTPRFPEGLTVWEALGQWRRSDGRIAKEKAKVLLLVHADTALVRTSLEALVVGYKQKFQQESVLWETTPVCAAF